MNGRDRYAARLAKAKKKAQSEKARRRGAAKQAFTDSHLKLHKHARDQGSGPFEKFSWRRGDVLVAKDETKFSLRTELYKCALYQEILCHIVGREENGKQKKAVLKVMNVAPDRIYPEGRKVDEEEIVSLISSAGDSPALAQSLCIFMHECFHVIAFEPYSVDLTSYLGDDPTEVRFLRFILRQVLDGMRCLERLGIVHGDLRGTNIRLLKKDHIRVRINITGFQFAQFRTDIVQGSIMQTAETRAPEVIVGGEITEAIDMWTVACTFSYQNTVEDAFQGETPLHVLWSIVEQQGELPDWLLNSGFYTEEYFERKKGVWQLKPIDDPVYVAEHTPDAALENYGEAHELDESMFWELIGQMLDVDPKKRITPTKALEHPFITMTYLNLGVSAIKYSKYAKMCAELVDPSLPLSHYYIRKAAEDFPSEALSPANKKNKPTKKKEESSSDD